MWVQGLLVMMLLGRRGHTPAPGPSVFSKMEHRLKTYPFHMPEDDLGQLCVALASMMLKSSDALDRKLQNPGILPTFPWPIALLVDSLVGLEGLRE